jgi:hypothetical protein
MMSQLEGCMMATLAEAVNLVRSDRSACAIALLAIRDGNGVIGAGFAALIAHEDDPQRVLVSYEASHLDQAQGWEELYALEEFDCAMRVERIGFDVHTVPFRLCSGSQALAYTCAVTKAAVAGFLGVPVEECDHALAWHPYVHWQTPMGASAVGLLDLEGVPAVPAGALLRRTVAQPVAQA